jgi:hypothetical protein
LETRAMMSRRVGSDREPKMLSSLLLIIHLTNWLNDRE